ncbi:MAG TPA: ABC transporter ATP-binding protein, partial [Polyangiaceae bacterium]|nr:ABC transporter ATP-binding protein [Polyangiaceae bacterium]
MHEITPPPSNLRVLRRLLAVTWRYRTQTLFVVLLQIVLLGMTLSGLEFTGLAVDIVRRQLDASAPPPSWPFGLTLPAMYGATAQLLMTAVIVAAAAAMGAALNYAYSVAVGRLVHLDIVAALRLEIFAKLQRLSFRFFDQNSTGSIVNRVTVDVQMLRSFVDGVVIQGSVLFLALSVFLTYMLNTHVRLTAVSLALTPLLFAATAIFSRWAKPAYREGRRLADGLIRTMAETVEGVQVVKVFGQERAQIQRFLDQNARVREQQFAIFKNVSRFSPIISLLNQLNVIVLLGYGGVLVARAELTLGELVVFVGLLRQVATRATTMAEIINVLQQSFAGARRVFELLDAPAEVKNAAHPILPGRFVGGIRFDGVAFGYKPESPVVAGVSLELRPGECLGIWGGTGSGKSTLLSLLLRSYDPTLGRILVDGIDLRRYDLEGLRRQVGVVFQESLLFHDTVANNIAYADPEASLERIRAAARVAGADRFIQELA